MHGAGQGWIRGSSTTRPVSAAAGGTTERLAAASGPHAAHQRFPVGNCSPGRISKTGRAQLADEVLQPLRTRPALASVCWGSWLRAGPA